jgi:hypothetical protein
VCAGSFLPGACSIIVSGSPVGSYVPGDTAAATWALKAFALDSVDGKEAAFLACGAAMSTTMTIV